MSLNGKKNLYQPAPERPETPPMITLPQGEILTSLQDEPKIRKGLAGTRDERKQLSSTQKSSKSRKVGPIVVRHPPVAAHTSLKTGDAPGKEVAQDTVEPPRSVRIGDSKKSSGKYMIPQNQSSSAVSKRPGSSRGRFVESRYKQAAASFGTGASFNTTASSSGIKSKCLENSQQASYLDLKTPVVKRNIGKTSTPTSLHNPTLDWNTSCIEKSQSNVCDSKDEVPQKKKTPPKKLPTGKDNLELLYCDYFQWHYLNSKLKTDARAKAQQAATELSFMHRKNQEVSMEVSELAKEVTRQMHLAKLKKQLESQDVVLGPVVDKLDDIKDQFKTLAENLDTTRHNLPLHGIINPDPDKLESVLDESRHLLGQVNILTHSQAPAIDAMSKSSQMLAQHCTEEAKKITVTKNMIEKQASMVLKQASLVTQLDNMNADNI